MKKTIKNKFFVFNPKSYLYGEELLKLAKKADELATQFEDITIFVTTPYADIANIKNNTKNIIVTAQHIDGIEQGKGIGAVLGESVYNAGARATFLNHAEKPLTFSELVKSVKKAKQLEMITIVCADSLEEAKAIATLNPDIILCEPTELIGTGQTSDKEYITSTNNTIKDVNKEILVMQAAGISNADDVYRTISLGADGTGCTSGIIKAPNRELMLEEMIKAIKKATEEV